MTSSVLPSLCRAPTVAAAYAAAARADLDQLARRARFLAPPVLARIANATTVVDRPVPASIF